MLLVVAAARQQRRSSRGTQRAVVHTGIIVGANGRLTRQPMGCAREHTLRRSRPAQQSGLQKKPSLAGSGRRTEADALSAVLKGRWASTLLCSLPVGQNASFYFMLVENSFAN